MGSSSTALRIFCSLSIGLLTATTFSRSVLAQEEAEVAAAGVSVEHEPPSAELPDPGLPLKLVAQLRNSDEFSYRMRLLAVIDGQVSDIPVSISYLNKFDQPEYVAEIFAPQSELSYQFFIEETPGGRQVPSPRYSIRRECKPVITPVETHVDASVQGEDRLQLLNQQAISLQREISVYNHLLGVVHKLGEEMATAQSKPKAEGEQQ